MCHINMSKTQIDLIQQERKLRYHGTRRSRSLPMPFSHQRISETQWTQWCGLATTSLLSGVK